jgi:hypothetical protein
MRAKGRGVTDAFERERVVGHSGDDVQIGSTAASNDDVIVVHAAGMAFIGLMFDFVLSQIDVEDSFSAAEDSRQ